MLPLTLNPSASEAIIRRSIIAVALYLILPMQALWPLDDPDVWWRFRVGEWIVHNRAVPFVDYFSAYDSGKPWIEYAWPLALLMYGLHAHYGLTAIVYFIVAMALAITAAVHRLILRSGAPFYLEAALAGAALGAMKPLMTPRPWLFTILFFAIELWVIRLVRHSGRDRLLWALPALFAVWANCHVQFVYGLAVIFLLWLDGPLTAMLQRYGWNVDARAAPRHMALVAMACVAATLLTPYHVLLYRQIFDYIGGQTGIFQNIRELHPMFFRTPGDWLVLFLTLAASFALGWRQKWTPFQTLLLLIGAGLAFRARRDVWMLVLAALYVIGDAFESNRPALKPQFTKVQFLLCTLAVAAAIYLASAARGISEPRLQQEVRKIFPVEAANYVKEHNLPGPLFNDYDWGGFLLWSLPSLPVVMDGRVNLYGDGKFERSLNTWQGRAGWETDPDLARANVIIAPKHKPLTNLLRASPNYRSVYEDGVAQVFVPAR